MRLGLGLGIPRPAGRRGGGAPWHPVDIPDLQRGYVADETPEATTPYWGDISGNGRVLYANSSANVPAYSAAAVDGKPGNVWASTDRMLSQNVVDDRIFHDGTGCTIALQVHPDGAAATQIIMATNNLAGVGFFLSHDGSNNRFVMSIRNAAGAIFTYAGVNGSAPEGVPYQLEIRIDSSLNPDVTVWLDGTQVASGNFSSAPDAGNPVGALSIGTHTSAGSNWPGKIRYLLIWSRGLTDEEIATVRSNMAAGYTSRRTVRKVWPVGESTTASASSWRVRLWYRAQASATTKLDFVGDATPAGVYTLPSPEHAHDGYAGFTIDQLKTQIQGGTITSSTGVTDVVLMEGTNDCVAEDMTDGPTLAAAMARLELLMAEIESRAPTARKYLCTIPISTSGTTGPRVDAYNDALPAVATSRGWTLIDLEAGAFGLVSGDISGDLIHPTSSTAPAPPNALAGYDKIGETIANGLGL